MLTFNDVDCRYLTSEFSMDIYCKDLHGVDEESVNKLLQSTFVPYQVQDSALNCAIVQELLSLSGALESF